MTLWTPDRQRARTAKPIHYADKIRHDGAVSALCYPQPRAIDLTRATWTNRDEAVTCPKCRQILDGQKGEP